MTQTKNELRPPQVRIWADCRCPDAARSLLDRILVVVLPLLARSRKAIDIELELSPAQSQSEPTGPPILVHPRACPTVMPLENLIVRAENRSLAAEGLQTGLWTIPRGCCWLTRSRTLRVSALSNVKGRFRVDGAVAMPVFEPVQRPALTDVLPRGARVTVVRRVVRLRKRTCCR